MCAQRCSPLTLSSQASVKKIILQNEDIGKVSQTVPIMLCKCFVFGFALWLRVLLHPKRLLHVASAPPLTCRSLFAVCSAAKATECFLADLVRDAGKLCVEQRKSSLTIEHMWVVFFSVIAFFSPLSLPASLSVLWLSPPTCAAPLATLVLVLFSHLAPHTACTLLCVALFSLPSLLFPPPRQSSQCQVKPVV